MLLQFRCDIADRQGCDSSSLGLLNVASHGMVFPASDHHMQFLANFIGTIHQCLILCFLCLSSYPFFCGERIYLENSTPTRCQGAQET